MCCTVAVLCRVVLKGPWLEKRSQATWRYLELAGVDHVTEGNLLGWCLEVPQRVTSMRISKLRNQDRRQLSNSIEPSP